MDSWIENPGWPLLLLPVLGPTLRVKPDSDWGASHLHPSHVDASPHLEVGTHLDDPGHTVEQHVVELQETQHECVQWPGQEGCSGGASLKVGPALLITVTAHGNSRQSLPLPTSWASSRDVTGCEEGVI